MNPENNPVVNLSKVFSLTYVFHVHGSTTFPTILATSTPARAIDAFLPDTVVPGPGLVMKTKELPK